MTDEERKAVVAYRIQCAHNTMKEAALLKDNGYWNAATNRLYYACYYAVSALLVDNNIQVQTHAGVRQMLGREFVLTGKISPEYSKFYSILFTNRQSGDYEDFIQITQGLVDSKILCVWE